jgi:hypothetical protein
MSCCRNPQEAIAIVSVMCGSWSSSVDIVTTVKGGRPEESSRFPAGATDFLYITLSRPGLRSTQPPIQWVPGVKRQKCETDSLPASSVEIMNALELKVCSSICLHVKCRMLFTGDGLRLIIYACCSLEMPFTVDIDE